ncbi:MAG: methyltransferase family protein [Methanotrichaceae archaeon]
MFSSTLIVALYFVAFATLHSLLASLRFKRLSQQVFGPGINRWYRLAYFAFATFSALPIPYMLFFFPGQTLYVVSSPWRWLMIAGQILAAVGFAKAFLETDPLQFLGFKPQPREGRKLLVRGFYCRVRNPLFLFGLIFIWLISFMTVNLLTVYIQTTVYFYLGSMHEERQLFIEFGDAYIDYQKRVPWSIPRLGKCYPKTHRP